MIEFGSVEGRSGCDNGVPFVRDALVLNEPEDAGAAYRGTEPLSGQSLHSERGRSRKRGSGSAGVLLGVRGA